MGFGKLAATVAVALAAACGMAAGQAQAGEVYAGVYGHDVTFVGNVIGLGAAGREGGTDFHLGYRTDRIEALHFIGKPHVHVFGSINTNNTSNFVAAGFDWKVGLRGPIYLRPGMGLAYTDGKTELPSATQPGISAAEAANRTYLYYHRIAFGSKVLFEPELALGVDVSDRLSLEASYTHLSNGQIFHKGKNQGLDDAGVRVNWKFGK
jgi:lipid A 3-O-deacylase